MNIKQISIFIENKKGRLAEVTKILEENNINIRALSLADTSDFGILRIIVNEPEKCKNILYDKGFIVKESNVLAVEIEDKPGGLARVLGILSENDINIEYMYAFVEKKENNAIVIFKVDNNEKTVSILSSNNINTVPDDILRNL